MSAGLDTLEVVLSVVFAIFCGVGFWSAVHVGAPWRSRPTPAPQLVSIVDTGSTENMPVVEEDDTHTYVSIGGVGSTDGGDWDGYESITLSSYPTYANLPVALPIPSPPTIGTIESTFTTAPPPPPAVVSITPETSQPSISHDWRLTTSVIRRAKERLRTVRPTDGPHSVLLFLSC